MIAEVTKRFQAIAFSGQVFDSSVFVGTLYNGGRVVDEYIDYPDYLNGLGTHPYPSILNLERAISVEQRATEWANLFEVPEMNHNLMEVFRRRDDYLFAEDFYIILLETLSLPTTLVGAHYIEIERAYSTEPEAQKTLLHANGAID